MSLLNVFVTPSHAIVYSDTMAGPPGGGERPGEQYEAAKMIPLVATNALVAFRGRIGFAATCSMYLHMAPDARFDTLADQMPGLLEAAWSEFLRHVGPLGIEPAHVLEQEVALVGWSDSQSRIDACVYQKVEEGGTFEEFAPEGDPDRLDQWDVPWVTPWPDRWGPLPQLETLDDHLGLAREQVRRVRADRPGVNIGGRLIGAEITRQGLRVFQVGML